MPMACVMASNATFSIFSENLNWEFKIWHKILQLIQIAYLLEYYVKLLE